jgi:DNA replication and repair protein RecF
LTVALDMRGAQAVTSRLAVTRLRLTNFRSYAVGELAVSGAPVVLAGPNGAGKTNVLDAISLLSPGRGLRGAKLAEHTRKGPVSDDTLWAVAATVARGGTEYEIGTGMTGGSASRQVRLNGAPAQSSADLGDVVQLIWLTPAMDRLFIGSAGDRRRFLDRLVLALEPGHAHHASRYEAAMRGRNKLLADEAQADPSWLAALEEAMAEHGTAIAGARARTVAALSERLESALETDFARADIALDGWDIGDLAAALRTNRARDAAAGRAIEGPHRHDLAVTHHAKEMPAASSSTGEQKALLLGLVLAHAELVADRRGEPPILLLDEVAAHLDPKRRAALFARLEGRGQVWMTATEAALFDGIGTATRFHIEPGTAIPA